MNHKYSMLATIAMAATIVVIGTAATATPQQALAGGHHHHSNGVKVSQSTDQTNVCGIRQQLVWLTANDGSQSTVCLNQGTNNADIQR